MWERFAAIAEDVLGVDIEAIGGVVLREDRATRAVSDELRVVAEL